MKKSLIALMLLAGSTAFAQVRFGVNVGVGAPGYYPPPGAYAAPPVCGPGSVWIDGYTDAYGYWVDGYCAVPPYAGAYWIAPRFYGGRFIAGYWGGHYGSAYGYRDHDGYRGYDGYRGGARVAPRSQGSYGNGYRSGGAAPSYRSQGGASNSFRSQGGGSFNSRAQGNYRGGGSSSRGGGSGHGGRR